MYLLRYPFTIGTRLFIGFSGVLAIFLFQAFIAGHALDTVVQHFNDYNRISGEANEILIIEKEVAELRRGVLSFTYSGYEGVIASVRRLQSSLAKILRHTHDTLDDPERRNLIERMQEHFHLYNETFETAIHEHRLRNRLMTEELQVQGYALVRTLRQLRDDTLEIQDFPKTTHVGLALDKLLEAHRDALSFIVEPDSILVRSTQESLTQSSVALKILRESFQENEKKQLVTSMLRDISQFEKTFFNVVQATRGYLYLVYVVMPGEAAEISALASDLKNRTLARQEEIRARMGADVRSARHFSALVTTAAGFFGLLAAWLITRSLSIPLHAITNTFTELAEGRLEHEIPGRGRQDEIGALAQAADVFKQKAYELNNASRYKTEFLANMSHELRTPLNSLLILSKLFSDNTQGNLTEEQLESAKVIHESATSLLHIINDVLDLSKIEAGRMEVYPEAAALIPFTKGIERQFQYIAADKRLQFEVELKNNVPDTFRTDWGKLEQIIRNLISNALKFTLRGSVRLIISRSTSEKSELLFAVQDTGIGIPKDKFAQIFEAFRQVDGSTSRKYGGTGLGLSISRHFSGMLGGELHVESTEGQGSVFTLRIPIHYFGSHETLPFSKEKYLSSSLNNEIWFKHHRIKVLAVDDDERNQYALKQILVHRVEQVWSAGDGEAGLKILADHPDIDIVIMDIMMPKMDGYEAIHAIRAQNIFQSLPIIALTARALSEDKIKCLSVGASAYLSKPVAPELLIDTIVQCLSPIFSTSTHMTGIIPKIDTITPVPYTAACIPLSYNKSPSYLLNSDGNRITVLVVDDDMRNTYSLSRALQPLVHTVLMAANGEKGLALLASRPEIDIALLDLRMPEMDGITLLRTIRSEERHKNLPIIILTASAMPGDHEMCEREGADGYLIKPVEFEKLRSKMEYLLSGCKHIG